MASGFGYDGGRSRCFSYWQEFLKCYAQTDRPGRCRAPADDYMECLHHSKEIKRNRAIREQFLKVAAQKVKEGRKEAEIRAEGVIVNLGLISKDKDKDKVAEESKAKQ